MSNSISLIKTDVESRENVLNRLGYFVDDQGFVIDKSSNENLICKYSDEPVHIDKAAILPGSIIIINADILTMSQYLLEHGN